MSLNIEINIYKSIYFFIVVDQYRECIFKNSQENNLLFNWRTKLA